MSASVKATCVRCGTVTVPLAAARLEVAVDASDHRNSVMFDCPACGMPSTEKVSERGTRLLADAGITLVSVLETYPVDNEQQPR